MKQTIDDHADRFDRWAEEYDDADRPIYEACRDRVIEDADPGPDDIVLDLGMGTGAVSLALAEAAATVVGRDISDEMMGQAREKMATMNIDNVSIDTGRFRAPNYDGPADIVTSNYALHHLDDESKRSAIDRIAQYRPRRFVLGDLMFFAEPDSAESGYDPEVDDPATVGLLTEAITDAGFVIVDVTRMSDHAGVITAEEPRGGWKT